MTILPLDFDARDRTADALIRHSLDSTLFVEAGAGTGKTHALVDRVVALVLSGKRIERLVAITFTERAAVELRDRVRGGLERARLDSPENAAGVDTALASLDRAQISTIHSFCQQLLYSYAAESGIDPSFRVADEVQAERRFQQRWRDYLEQIPNDADAAAAFDRVLGLGLTPRDIEKLAIELARRSDLASRLASNPIPAPLPFRPNLTEMEHDLEQLPLTAASETDELRLRLERLLALVKNLSRSSDDVEPVLAAGAGILKVSYNKSSTAAWGGGGVCREVREAAQNVCERLSAMLESCRSEALADLLPLIVRFVLDDTRERGREGLLTFDDLILRVRDLLRNSMDAARSLRDRYDALLIDEFQDTDPLQVDIARAFAADPETGRLEPGRLFLVGDPKQSIYRFRRADMAIYAQTRTLMAEQGAEFADLALNRRSRPVILDWVNHVFANMIGDGDNPAVQPPYRVIHPARDESLAGPGTAWIGEELDLRAREARRVESGALARQCQEVLKEGWEVIEEGRKRAASLRDIAILIPARTILAPLERALADSGIPYRVEGGSLIYRTQEVRDLVNCLTAIDDAADDVAIVGALRSPAFACSDVEIARHKAGGGTFNYLSVRQNGHGSAVTDALEDLARRHDAKHESSLAALVETFATERGLVEIGILDQGNRNSFRRTRFVIEQARAFEANGPESLRAFVAWMERRSSETILDNEGAAVDDDEDAVHILTIHGAKGLEFPIVFAAGLTWAPQSRTDVYNTDYSTGNTAVCIGTSGDHRRFTLGDSKQLTALQETHADAEHARLLYVAATRARDHLVISLYRARRSVARSGAKRLIANGAQEFAPGLPEPRAIEQSRAMPFEGLAVDAPSISTAAFEEGRTTLVADSKRKVYTSATALVRGASPVEGEARKSERTDESEPWARGRGGTQRGRAVHAAIQSLPLDADDSLIEAFSRAQAVAEAIPQRAADVARLVGWVLHASQAMTRARAAPRALREVPFAVEMNGKVLEGFIDLVIDTPQGIEIVDWKTDDVSPSEVPARLEQYRLQAGLYVLGIEAATGRPVSGVTYVFAEARVEKSPGDPRMLADAARLELSRRLSDVSG